MAGMGGTSGLAQACRTRVTSSSAAQLQGESTRKHGAVPPHLPRRSGSGSERRSAALPSPGGTCTASRSLAPRDGPAASALRPPLALRLSISRRSRTPSSGGEGLRRLRFHSRLLQSGRCRCKHDGPGPRQQPTVPGWQHHARAGAWQSSHCWPATGAAAVNGQCCPPAVNHRCRRLLAALGSRLGLRGCRRGSSGALRLAVLLRPLEPEVGIARPRADGCSECTGAGQMVRRKATR